MVGMWFSGRRYGAAGLTSVLVAASFSAGLVGSLPNAGAAGPTIAVASSVEQIRPTTSLAGRPTSASLVAARNEFESFQILVQGPASAVSVAGNLFGWNSTQLSAVRYVEVIEPSDGEGGAGRWGDVLVPESDLMYGEDRNAFPFDVPAGENRVVWVDVFVPPDTIASTYSGSLTVTSNDGAAIVPVSLEVLNIDLPSTSSLRNAFYWSQDAPRPCAIDGCVAGSTEERELYSMYTRLALENRVTIVNGSGLYNDQAPADYGSDTDWESLYEAPNIRGVGPAVPATATWRLAGPKLTVVGNFNYASFHCLRICMANWAAEANEAGQGFARQVAHYGCDEANNSLAEWTACATAANEAIAGFAAPVIATATLGQYNTYRAASAMPDVSYLTVPLNRMYNKEGNQDAGDQRPLYNAFDAQPGHDVWLYTSCLSHGCLAVDEPFGSPSTYWDGWAGYAIDAPAVQHRAMGLLAWRFQAPGELYWSVNKQMTGFASPGGMFGFGVNGDGTLLYAGRVADIGGTHGIPLESVRLKRIRDGREDYEWVKWLAENGKTNEVNALVEGLFPNAYSATAEKDGFGPGSLVATRGQLAQLVRDVAGGGAIDRPIVFASDRDGDFELFAMTDTGGSQVPLTANTVADRFPAWSPSGQKIAWTQGSEILVMNSDGTGAINLTADIADGAEKPAWSGDGSVIVFVRSIGGHSEIWRMSAIDGSAKQPIVTFASAGRDAYDPAVSYDGDVFYSEAGDIYRVPLAGGARVGVITGSTVDEVPDIGNLTSQLAFSRSADGATPYDVMVTNADCSSASNVTATVAGGPGANDIHGSWSPDDQRLVLAAAESGDYEIWVTALNGANAVPLTNNSASDQDPDWRADPRFQIDTCVALNTTWSIGQPAVATVPAIRG